MTNSQHLEHARQATKDRIHKLLNKHAPYIDTTTPTPSLGATTACYAWVTMIMHIRSDIRIAEDKAAGITLFDYNKWAQDAMRDWYKYKK